MGVEIVTREDLQSFRIQLLNDIKQFLGTPSQPAKQWLKSQEVRKLLNISASTLQKFRINGTLQYTRMGTIMYYNYEDIVKVLESNMIGAE
jgi:hypothetical protein